VIGIASVLPREGKSTTALNFAELLAIEKGATLLIDCDLRNPTLSRNVAPDAKTGLVDCATDRLPIAGSVLRDPTTGLMFLPVGSNRRIRNTSEFFSSSLPTDVLGQASKCEYVVLDLPPAGVVVDTRAIAPKVDAFILVVEWGKTARRLVQSVLANDPILSRKCVGVILNRADMRKIKRYQKYGSSEFYSDRISQYYKSAP
jgi:polysaccharide biosynthesis transport protein